MRLQKLRRKVERHKPDEVDRAVASVKSAVGRLSRLVFSDDLRLVKKAAASVFDIGAFAAGPVAKAISRAPDPRQRMALLLLLEQLGSFTDPDVIKILMRVSRKDANIMVAQRAGMVLSNLMDQHFLDTVKRDQAGARRSKDPVDGRPDPPPHRDSIVQTVSAS
jgi:hypothetical protein